MDYVLYGLVAAYLIFGVVLTHSVISGMHRRRGKVRDWMLGVSFMPVVFVLGLVCLAFEKLWARLKIVLDLEPVEELRAGPKKPSVHDTGQFPPT